MINKQYELSLRNYINILNPLEKKDELSLKDPSYLPIILDTLNRKEHHHAILLGSCSEKFNLALLERIALSLAEKNISPTLKNSCFFYVDVHALATSTIQPEKLEHDFKIFSEEIAVTHNRFIFAINQIEPLLTEGRLGKLIKSILANEQWRVIIITNKTNQQSIAQQPIFNRFFSLIKLTEPTAAESLSILKTFRHDLENFHQISIPDEAFSYALSMSAHYLGNHQSCLDKSLQLLDSGAARASATIQHDVIDQTKPILTNAILANVVSNWTQIPLSHLQQNKFKAADFIQGMQKHIFGQESAINLIGFSLQHSRMKLYNKHSPLCSFLFAGPAHTGKTTSAHAIAEQLFGHSGALLRVNLDNTYRPTSLSEINIMAFGGDNYCPRLLEAIQQNPYAVVLFENINHATPGTIDLFQDIFTQGYAIDNDGNKYDFRHAIVIVTTTLGTERIISLTQPKSTHETSQADLMQLVLNEHKQNSLSHHRHLSPQELCEEIAPVLETYFSTNLLRHFNIIPFTLLDAASIEKIIRLKLRAFALQLEANFTIELSYAPEVMRFLVQKISWQGNATKSIDKILEQNVYSCIAHELLSKTEEKNHPKKLLLQLNDTGQVLRCELITQNETALY